MSRSTLKLSGSSLSILSCKRRYYFQNILGYHPPDKAEAMERGDFFHRLAECYYRLIKSGENIQGALNATITYAREIAVKYKSLSIEQTEFGIETLKEYVHYHPSDDWVPEEVEVPFSKLLFENDDVTILYEGRADLLVKSRANRFYGIPPVDHKTTERAYTPHRLDNQFLGLAWVFNSPIVIHNQIGYQKSYIGKPEKRFFRYVLSYEKEIVKEWHEWTIVKALSLYERIKESLKNEHDIQQSHDEWEPDYSQCKYCPFAIVCENPQSSREWILNTKFAKSERRYDVLEGE